MKSEELYEAFGSIDEKYIQAARRPAAKKVRPAWLRWGTIAACLCLIAAGAFTVTDLLRGRSGISDNARDYAVKVIYNDEQYFVCGQGESGILEQCGLPGEITEELAGPLLGYLEMGEKNIYRISGEKSGDELFAYAPVPNGDVFILCLDGKYYAAIRHDSLGYHGLDGSASSEQ